MMYTETQEESFFSTLRMAEGICLGVKSGWDLSTSFENERDFRIPSTMMAIDTLLEYGWERAANIALLNGAKAKDVITPEELAEFVGRIMAGSFVDSLEFLQKEEGISDEEVVSFLEYYYKETDGVVYRNEGEVCCWDLHNLYLEWRNK